MTEHLCTQNPYPDRIKITYNNETRCWNISAAMHEVFNGWFHLVQLANGYCPFCGMRLSRWKHGQTILCPITKADQDDWMSGYYIGDGT